MTARKSANAVQLKRATAALMERGDAHAIGVYFSPNYIAHTTDQNLEGGHALIRRVVAMYQKAFTDITITLDILAEQGDRVAWQRTLRATHSGAFKGFPATNLQMTWREMAVSQFKDGLIVEEWFITDLAEQFLLTRKSWKK
jgi:predicted ester cyclase